MLKIPIIIDKFCVFVPTGISEGRDKDLKDNNDTNNLKS